MTTLDARARNAAHAIKAGVAEFTPAATFDAVVVRQQRWRTMQAGLAGAVTAAVIVIVGIAATPSPAPEVADTPTTLVTTTIVPPQPEVVPPPVVTSTTEVPVETTTTTTAAPAVTTTTSTTEPPDTTPPLLTITSPKPEEHFEVETIDFRGTTEPGATVFAGPYEADVDSEGNWSIRLILSPGANGALFVATDAAGNQTQARVTVYYDVPETTTTKPPAEVEFTAYQQFGSCEETPPYDIFWGTAPPGTPIYVESEYGSGVTEANEHGEWEIQVFFPEAPPEKVFAVKVKDNKGNKKWFEFIHYV
ncbi:MAG: hypothetical protein QNJ77_02905 [Acidimicrobiia bacterium]|nr:hypothetical protein [Acidimicrobiia bacterium]